MFSRRPLCHNLYFRHQKGLDVLHSTGRNLLAHVVSSACDESPRRIINNINSIEYWQLKRKPPQWVDWIESFRGRIYRSCFLNPYLSCNRLMSLGNIIARGEATSWTSLAKLIQLSSHYNTRQTGILQIFPYVNFVFVFLFPVPPSL